ncbi:MAG: 4-carboxy-4-hydroxy-2-oxoadipate aldolase/oxaloacetate decarboxylase [Rhizomicrobium sp.]
MSGRFDPSRTTRTDFPRVASHLVQKALGLPTATLHEAGGRIGALPCAIKPIAAGMRLAGPAFTVHSPGGDNLWLHRAIVAAQAGDVLVVHADDAYEYGYWGEIMATAAQARGIAGLVIDGGVRDAALLEEMNFPAFSRTVCIRGTAKDFTARGFLGHPLRLGDADIQPGDLIVGDRDGVVAIPRARADEIILAAQNREAKEAEILQRLLAGETTMGIYDLGV